MADNALFIDTNVLVYANVIESPFHDRVLAALEAAHQANRPLWISRQIIREYLVTMTRPQTFQTLPRETVLEQVGLFTERFTVADDAPAVTAQLLQLMAAYKLGGKQVHDANVVATMLAYGVSSLLTCNDKDFQRFDDVIAIETG
ncbi:MAG: PIN domain-containing protein [Gammaproteobacteria bacterium]|nr:PIN domain-containing protein [Gammaproteobacteria bacterium]